MVLDKPIIAVDFDGTITTGDTRIWIDSKPNNDVFNENLEVTEFLRTYRDRFYLVLWTCREGSSLNNAVEYCRSIGIVFDAVNENVAGVFPTSAKVYADIYLDDKGTFDLVEVSDRCQIL